MDCQHCWGKGMQVTEDMIVVNLIAAAFFGVFLFLHALLLFLISAGVWK